VSHLEEVPKGLLGLNVTCNEPFQELGDIHAPDAYFALENPRLVLAELLSQRPLRQPSFLANTAKIERQLAIKT
jgi:hypothetical protein